MTFLKRYQQYKDQWWALPLFLPVVLLPFVILANTSTQIAGGVVTLYYLPLAFFISLMLFFGWAALPGITLALVFHYYPHTGGMEILAKTVHFLIPTILSWAGYRLFVTRRHMVSYGNADLMGQRLFWQVICPAAIILLIFQLATYLGMYNNYSMMAGSSPWSVRTLINFQALMVGCLTGIPMCYLLIRIIRHPRYVRSFITQMRREFHPRCTRVEVVLWLGLLIVILGFLLQPMNEESTIFSSNYTLTLLMPVMLWGAMRFGYRFMSVVWTPFLIVAVHYFYCYLPVRQDYGIQLTITSSSYLVFSFIINYMSMLATSERMAHVRVRKLAYLDPVMHMPNLRALNRALADTPWSVLCFLRVPELEMLGRNYGVMLRIQYKQKLAEWVRQDLHTHEDVYHLSGPDLVIRLNTESYEERIDALDARIKQFRFVWDGMPLQPQVGISYCYVRSPVVHLYLLLGELSTVADLSLATNHPESLQRRGAASLQRGLKDKVEMMNRLQQALEADRFVLLAQPIAGIRGDNYHEILLRMVGDNGEYIGPDSFLPVAHELGLSSRIDKWVIENTLRFMDAHRDVLPGQRFAINLSPSSVCRAQFTLEVSRLLKAWNIEAWQLIFEVTESNSLTNIEQANQTLGQLQHMGCRVAIDDFGTGYASYARLKNVNADILKIDGSFIRNITSNSLDYQIVASIVHLARMKKMQVVAEYVESEEILRAAMELGIDYMQGYLIGKPEPLSGLVERAALPSLRA
ncbi:EAL domain-containing protein [Enterobacter sp.]|uniref:EAL domain-containing protein n=1 Tax=Enterobacter sp. TaxID=42895 RepID=UPI00296E273C|nr:EAL domain-containing protein [Enterobacter sp.]